MGSGSDTTLDQRIARLRTLDLFASLEDETLERLASALVRLAFHSGALILRQGDEGEYLYFIASGEVDIVESDGRVAVLGPGDYFGDAALLRNGLQPATVVARTAVILHALDGATFLDAVSARRA